MLIICPECNKEVSDKTEKCIHCGFPISEIPHGNICIIDGTPRDLTEQLENLDNPTYQPCKKFGQWGMGIREASTLYWILKQTRSVPREFNSADTEKYRQELSKAEQDNKPKCPTCSSTNISSIGTVERVGSVAMFGVFSKKINKSFKCKSCGYTW